MIRCCSLFPGSRSNHKLQDIHLLLHFEAFIQGHFEDEIVRLLPYSYNFLVHNDMH